MPVSQAFNVNVVANQLFTSGVSSGAQLTLNVPYTCNNLTVDGFNYEGAGGWPALVWQIDQDGNVLANGGTVTPSTATFTFVPDQGGTLTVPLTLPQLAAGTVAVVINTALAVSVTVPTGQTGTITPTYSIVQQNPSGSVSVDFDVDHTNLTLGSSARGTCVNFPASNNSSATVLQPYKASSGLKREIGVVVPINFQPSQTTPYAYVMVPFTVPLSFAG